MKTKEIDSMASKETDDIKIKGQKFNNLRNLLRNFSNNRTIRNITIF